jgi:hypothetical protein
MKYEVDTATVWVIQMLIPPGLKESMDTDEEVLYFCGPTKFDTIDKATLFQDQEEAFHAAKALSSTFTHIRSYDKEEYEKFLIEAISLEAALI